jgi:hypothetical protein
MKRLTLATLAVLVAAPAFALEKDHHIGTRVQPAAAAEAGRVIVVDSGTRWVNVDHGETVLFRVNGPSGQTTQVWRFDGIDLRFPFSEVSPDAPKPLLVYVNQQTNPLYQKPEAD